MRWFAAALVYVLICSVNADDEEKDSLKIIANPTIVYNAGETKAIFCNSTVQPVQWISPSNKTIEKKSAQNARVYVEKMSPRGGVPLIIRHIKITDAGNWTCRAGELSDTIDIIVGEKVNFPERNVKMDGDEGKAVRMTCNATGYPTPVVVWYKGNSPIVNDHKKYVIRADNSLEIKKLDHTDAGTYVCKVRQKALSHYIDKNVHLAVKHKPILYNMHTQTIYNKFKAEEVYAILNETKNITCSALANPRPTFHWYKTEDGYDQDEIVDPDMVFHSEDGSNSVLMLRMEDDSVLGQYKCASRNSKGSESVIFHVSLGTKPDPPDFVAVVTTNVTEIVFNVSCSTCPMASEDDISPNPENLTITGFLFELVKHKDHFEPDWDTAHRVEVKIENENVTLFPVGGLDNTTKYHVRVASVNAAGYSEWYIAPGIAETTASAFRHCAAILIVAFFSSLLYVL